MQLFLRCLMFAAFTVVGCVFAFCLVIILEQLTGLVKALPDPLESSLIPFCIAVFGVGVAAFNDTRRFNRDK